MERVAQSAVSNVVQLLGEEYRLLRGVGGQVADLRDDLEAINALLVMQLEAEDGAMDRFVQVCMKQLRELAYDAEDFVDLYKLRIRCRPGDGVRARLNHLLGTLFARRRLAGEITTLQARAVAIGDRQARFGVNREALRRAPPLLPAASLAPASAVDAESRRHQLVGIDEQVDTLVQKLTTQVDDEEGDQLKVLSIVGFGGLGKTTLAMEVCRRLEEEFPHQAMVSVSQAFQPSRDLQVLLKRVLHQVVNPKTVNNKGFTEEGGLGDMDSLDVKGLAAKLEQCLEGKRYLIVIDDVWTTQAWGLIQSMLPENECSSRIMVTTRIEDVAKACSPSRVTGNLIHYMKPLEEEVSKKLLLNRVFGSMDYSSCPIELQDTMKNILKKCGGLPLAIISIASILAGYRSSGSKDKWEIVCKSIGSQMESNPTLEGMRQIVALSFNHLPHELKACMMYLTVFPEDYRISKKRLMCRWIAEGLVLEKRGLTMMEVAESYLDELLSRNMIEANPSDDASDAQSYRLHDMLLEVMVSKSLEANFVSLQGGQHSKMSYHKIRRLSIHDDILGVDSSTPKEKAGCQYTEEVDVRHVRSLSIFQVQGHKLLDQLEKFTLLRVLDLEGCKGVTNKHMRYACQLYLLRFLSLKDTNISRVPPQVRNLEHLQTFDLRGTLLDKLPEAITNLEKLEYLWFGDDDKLWSSMWKLPRGLIKMRALRMVNQACLTNNTQIAQEVGELEQLEMLKLCINQEVVDDKVLQVLALSLSKRNSSLRWLCLRDQSDGKLLNFLHHLQTPPRLLQILEIRGDMDGLPRWIGSLTHLVQLFITRTTLVPDHLFNELCKLPSLKTLCVLWKCYGGDELVVRNGHNFPVLHSLIFGGELPDVYPFLEGSMSKLGTLEIDIGNDEVERITGIEHMADLKKVTLKGKKNNLALNHALEKLKAESDKRPKSNQFQVVAKYY
ncbi:hypothetical protein ACP4OV_012201 [Aristida adscensionis]